MKKHLSEDIKKKIVKRYLNGERVTNLTKELWPNHKVNNQKCLIYDWTKKYSSTKEIEERKIERKIKKPKVIYELNLKYNYVMKYLNGESTLNLAKELWPNKDPSLRKNYIFGWKKELVEKGVLLANIKRKKKARKKINYEDFSKEELIEILRIYNEYDESIEDDQNKKKKFNAIKNNRNSILTIKNLCLIFNVSKSGYYKSLKNKGINKDLEIEWVIQKLFYKHKENPGYRKMTHYVNRKLNINFNHKKIYRIMKKLNLKSKIRVNKTKFEKKTLHIKRKYIINRNFKANKPMEKLFTDVTYIKTNEYKNVYLSPIIDSYNNEIVSFKFGKRNDKSLIIEPLKEILNKIDKNKTIINSDNGSIYYSNQYEGIAKDNFIISITRLGNCLDNRPIEYFSQSLKRNVLEKYLSRKEPLKD